MFTVLMPGKAETNVARVFHQRAGNPPVGCSPQPPDIVHRLRTPRPAEHIAGALAAVATLALLSGGYFWMAHQGPVLVATANAAASTHVQSLLLEGDAGLAAFAPQHALAELMRAPALLPEEGLPASQTWDRTLIPLAARGFTPDQERFLERVASGEQPLSVLARHPDGARLLDQLGGDPRHDAQVLRALDGAQIREVARAALSLSRGQSREAEAALRQGLSLGALLVREGGNVLAQAQGDQMMGRALEVIAQVRDAASDAQGASALRVARAGGAAEALGLDGAPLRACAEALARYRAAVAAAARGGRVPEPPRC